MEKTGITVRLLGGIGRFFPQGEYAFKDGNLVNKSGMTIDWTKVLATGVKYKLKGKVICNRTGQFDMCLGCDHAIPHVPDFDGDDYCTSEGTCFPTKQSVIVRCFEP